MTSQDNPERKEVGHMNALLKGAERARITIAGVKVEVPHPYREGYSLRQREADALNQIYVRNLRSNMVKIVTDMKAQSEGELSAVQIEAIQVRIDDYVSTYDFRAHRSRRVHRTGNLVEREAKEMAKIRVSNKIVQESGDQKLQEFKKSGQLESLIQDELAQNPALRKHAKDIVELRRQMTEIEES